MSCGLFACVEGMLLLCTYIFINDMEIYNNLQLYILNNLLKVIEAHTKIIVPYVQIILSSQKLNPLNGHRL